MTSGFFDVAPEQFGAFQQEKAVTFFRDLLWAEARRAGLPTTRCTIPTKIDAADGGIDAVVHGPDDSHKTDLLPPGLTKFQIKGGAFAPQSETQLKKELFGTTPSGRARSVRAAHLKHQIEAFD